MRVSILKGSNPLGSSGTDSSGRGLGSSRISRSRGVTLPLGDVNFFFSNVDSLYKNEGI